MDPREFSIGNILRCKGTGEMLFVRATTMGVVVVYPMDMKGRAGVASIPEPYPISETILLELGFLPYDGDIWQKEGLSIMLSLCGKWFVAIMDDNGYKYRPHFEGFEFVHELQNIFRNHTRKFLELIT